MLAETVDVSWIGLSHIDILFEDTDLKSKTYTKLIRDEYYKMRKDMND